MNLRPGTKVRVIQNAYENDDTFVGEEGLAVPKGSIATVLSYRQYCDHLRRLYREHGWNDSQQKKHLTECLKFVKEYMKVKPIYLHPIRFEKVARPSKSYCKNYCRGGQSVCKECEYEKMTVTTLPREFLEKI